MKKNIMKMKNRLKKFIIKYIKWEFTTMKLIATNWERFINSKYRQFSTSNAQMYLNKTKIALQIL